MDKRSVLEDRRLVGTKGRAARNFKVREKVKKWNIDKWKNNLKEKFKAA